MKEGEYLKDPKKKRKEKEKMFVCAKI